MKGQCLIQSKPFKFSERSGKQKETRLSIRSTFHTFCTEKAQGIYLACW